MKTFLGYAFCSYFHYLLFEPWGPLQSHTTQRFHNFNESSSLPYTDFAFE